MLILLLLKGYPRLFNASVCEADLELECLLLESYERFVSSNQSNDCTKGITRINLGVQQQQTNKN